MSGEIVPLKDKVLTVRDLFLKNKDQIQAALPDRKSVV